MNKRVVNISIALRWREIESKFLPCVGKVQRDEMRNAYYMGFADCLSTVMDISTNFNEEIGADMVALLNTELEIFFGVPTCEGQNNGH